MATTKAELWNQFLQLVKIVDEIYKFGASNTPNLLSLTETMQGLYEGVHLSQTVPLVAGLRSAVSSQVGKARALFTPVLVELARVGYDGTAKSIVAAVQEIREGMVAATETVRYRNHTFASVSAGGSNVGDGTILRLTVDKDGEDLEGGHPAAGTITCEVTKDFATGRTAGAEEMTIYGAGQVKVDELDPGECPSEVLVTTVKRAQDGLISNGTFETSDGSAGTSDTEFSGWTLSSQTDIDVETTEYYRGSTCLEFLDNANILQYLSAPSLDAAKPVFVSLMFKRLSSCDGNLTIRLGTSTETVALSAQSGWTRLVLGVADEDGWPANFSENYNGNGIRVQITLDSRTTGTLCVDEVVVIQPTKYDGKWYLPLAGATDFLTGDVFTFADTVANTGRTQYWVARATGEYLPQASSGETYADA